MESKGVEQVLNSGDRKPLRLAEGAHALYGRRVPRWLIGRVRHQPREEDGVGGHRAEADVEGVFHPKRVVGLEGNLVCGARDLYRTRRHAIACVCRSISSFARALSMEKWCVCVCV